MADLATQLRDRASKNLKRIVYPEPTDPRVLRSGERMVEMRMAQPVFVGSPQVIESKAQELGVRLSGIEIIDPKTRVLSGRYVGLLLPEWKSRGITEMEAHRRFENPMYFAAAMVRAGDADGFVGDAAYADAKEEFALKDVQCAGDGTAYPVGFFAESGNWLCLAARFAFGLAT